MRCPGCGNEVYMELGGIVQCTRCMSVFDPYIYPGFPNPDYAKITNGIWDTSETQKDEQEDDFLKNLSYLINYGRYNHNTSDHDACLLCGSHEHSSIEHLNKK